MFRARRMLIGLAAAAVLALLTACAVLRQPQFGADPEGERLERTRRSPHYVDGEFRSLVATRTLAEGQSTLAITVSDALNPASNLRPTQPVPTTRTDLKALDASRDTVVWLGHSSYFVLFAGKRILIDSVVSSFAGPFSFTSKAFDGTTLYGVDDLPDIDLLLITHDHWDHLDYDTVVTLQRKVGEALVALDMGQHDPRWPDIHMTPEQAAQAAEDLKARALVPAHVGRFSIARHAELKRQPGRATGHAPTEAKRARSLAIQPQPNPKRENPCHSSV